MYINVNNITIHYSVLGKGKELILLNPNSDSTLIMLPIAKIFSKYFKVYIVDRRGCGKSSKDCILTYKDSAEDIYQFITKLNIDKPYILGISGGASVLLHLAIYHQDILSKIVLCSRSSKNAKFKNTRFL